MKRSLAAPPGAIALAACVFLAYGETPPIEPPLMRMRAVAPPDSPEPGERLRLEVPGVPFLLFLPEGWAHAPPDRAAIHFHTPDWLAIGEHRRAGYRFPLVSIYLGAGSERYRVPFREAGPFERLMAEIEQQLSRRQNRVVRLERLDVASFSAGYGAVRELVKQPAAFGRIRRIVLSDSLYGGLLAPDKAGGRRVVEPAHVDCWVPFVRAAMRCEKAFVVTHTQVVTPSYASTSECASALLAAVGVTSAPAAPRLASAGDGDFPLLRRADAGCFHIWGYAGTNAAAHTSHAHHLADVWMALDKTAFAVAH